MARNLLIRGVVAAALIGLSGCSRSAPTDVMLPAQAAAVEPGGGAAAPVNAAAKDQTAKGQPLPASARKVIRNAELTMVVASPSQAELTISELVERLGGYIASSDHQAVSDSEARASLSLRVPVAHMEEALREIKKLSVGLANEKIGSDDVTDEYIDLTAHITNQQALEKQLTTILAQATSVDGALKVHHELAEVRTEIDRLQGRQRFLDGESALAKISVALAPKEKPPQVIAVAPVTFGQTLRDAVSDSVNVAKELTSSIVIFGVRAAGIVLPLAVLFGLPALVIAWLARKRYKRLTQAHPA